MVLTFEKYTILAKYLKILLTPYIIESYFKIKKNTFSIKKGNTYIKIEIRVVSREFLAFKYIFLIFRNKSDIYSLTSEIMISRLTPVFRYTISICICVGR